MVQVKSSRGGMVSVEIHGLNEVERMLKAKGRKITKGADFGVFEAGTFIQEEVKESIIGNRAEAKSVDTGRLANSIEFDKTGEAEGAVKPKKSNYPGTDTTTVDVAGFMEKKRHHFDNTKRRTIPKVKDIIQTEIKFG